MQINMDFAQRVVVPPEQHQWVSSPTPGVNRVMLDRDGVESGRATSLVRYAPNTTFPLHVHGGGEEILVLEGTFYDEHGVYPKGTWIRSPHLSAHQPYTKDDGALIYVKTGHLIGVPSR